VSKGEAGPRTLPPRLTLSIDPLAQAAGEVEHELQRHAAVFTLRYYIYSSLLNCSPVVEVFSIYVSRRKSLRCQCGALAGWAFGANG
jgi:hypothetical protein